VAAATHLSYPPWVPWGGATVAVAAAGYAVFAWTSGTPRWLAVVAAVAAVVGVSFVATARTNRFRIDDVGISRFERRGNATMRWCDVATLGTVGDGQGLRLVDGDGRKLDVPRFVRNFGTLCDTLLVRLPDSAELQGDAARVLVQRATLEPGELERAYAHCFGLERDDPPDGLDDDAIAAAAAESFALRMLTHHGDVAAFEARWDPKKRTVRIVHDVDTAVTPKRRRARAHCEYDDDGAPTALVVATASGTEVRRLRGGDGSP
jgi:hypothetical protein